MSNQNTTNFAGIAYNYLTLVSNCIDEMEKQGNQTMILTNKDSDWISYEKQIRWSDQSISIPLLFNFYHGVELLLKGILKITGIEYSTDHQLSKLFLKISQIKPKPSRLINILEKHISLEKSPFSSLFKENAKNIDDFYILLRYPIDKRPESVDFDFSSIKGQEDIGLGKYKIIRQDIYEIKESIIEWNQIRNLD